jgi:hypothetical protein
MRSCGENVVRAHDSKKVSASKGYPSMVKGYAYERGLKIRFEPTWLDKPQG